MKRTKILATVGPASRDVPTLTAMIDAGADVFRLNLSHGSVDEHIATAEMIRGASLTAGRDVAILADLPGPKIRANAFPAGGVQLTTGDMWRVVVSTEPSQAGVISVDYPSLLNDVQVGDRVVLGDGTISLHVTDIDGDGLVCAVASGGVAQGSPGIHLACAQRLSLRTPTAEDLVLAERMCAAGVEYVAVSFVTSADELIPVREVVNGRAHLVAKVETQSALSDLFRIVEAADAVMVARGDLGIDCPLEEVPHLQKHIIEACGTQGVPVITATQMLESMISAPAPTRAEVSDVANAVLDGTDAVMLSGETAIGDDPVNVVATMSRIVARAEHDVQRITPITDSKDATLALAQAGVTIAETTDAKAILVVTEAGNTAVRVAACRTAVPVLAMSCDSEVVRRMNLLSGVSPADIPEFSSTDDMVRKAVATATALNVVEAGDPVVLVAGAGDVIRILNA